MTPSKLALCALLAAACADRAPQPVSQEAPRGGRVGVHGMVVFGRERTFLSHIPASEPPHDLQIVLEIDPPRGLTGGPAELFTFAPRAFSLDDLAAGRLTSFEGRLFRGNFESGGALVLRDVPIHVRKIVLPAAPVNAAGEDAEYVLLGSTREAYLIHAIHGASFDRIALARVTGGATDAELASGLRVRIDGAASGPIVARRAGGAVQLDVERDVSCLVGPDFVRACPAR